MITKNLIALSLLACSFQVYSEFIEYRAWNNELSGIEPRHCEDFVVATNGIAAFDNGKWYVVDANILSDKRIVVYGTSHVILKDGARLTAAEGIEVENGMTLEIYGQTQGTGTIDANAPYLASAIGSSWHKRCGTIYIHGGTINATGYSPYSTPDGYGAGIGGGDGGSGGSITIYDGTIAAIGSGCGAGIGSGSENSSGGTVGGAVRIYGGNVTAIGGRYAAGIGGGQSVVDGGTVVIYGGTITAYSLRNGSGIGPGNGGYPYPATKKNLFEIDDEMYPSPLVVAGASASQAVPTDDYTKDWRDGISYVKIGSWCDVIVPDVPHMTYQVFDGERPVTSATQDEDGTKTFRVFSNSTVRVMFYPEQDYEIVGENAIEIIGIHGATTIGTVEWPLPVARYIRTVTIPKTEHIVCMVSNLTGQVACVDQGNHMLYNAGGDVWVHFSASDDYKLVGTAYFEIPEDVGHVVFGHTYPMPTVIAPGDFGNEWRIGDNVFASTNGCGTLHINGTGIMHDYNATNKVPWFNFAESIQDVEIERGITNIGKNLFTNMTSLASVNGLSATMMNYVMDALTSGRVSPARVDRFVVRDGYIYFGVKVETASSLNSSTEWKSAETKGLTIKDDGTIMLHIPANQNSMFYRLETKNND